MQSIDINCDMGEGMMNDAEIMPYISSANIACGYHAGNANIMRATVLLAKQYGIAIGAHPGFNDKENFGRIEMSFSVEEIYQLVVEQIIILQKICKQENVQLHHVKPHGALYNMAAKVPAISKAICAAILHANSKLQLYGLSGSHLISEAQKLCLTTVSEVFADRTYQNDGTLTSRSQPNALITETNIAIEQVLQMINSKTVTIVAGKKIAIKAETICLHGDGKHAVEFAKAIHQHLKQNNIAIATKK